MHQQVKAIFKLEFQWMHFSTLWTNQRAPQIIQTSLAPPGESANKNNTKRKTRVDFIHASNKRTRRLKSRRRINSHSSEFNSSNSEYATLRSAPPTLVVSCRGPAPADGDQKSNYTRTLTCSVLIRQANAFVYWLTSNECKWCLDTSEKYELRSPITVLATVLFVKTIFDLLRAPRAGVGAM